MKGRQRASAGGNRPAHPPITAVLTGRGGRGGAGAHLGGRAGGGRRGRCAHPWSPRAAAEGRRRGPDTNRSRCPPPCRPHFTRPTPATAREDEGADAGASAEGKRSRGRPPTRSLRPALGEAGAEVGRETRRGAERAWTRTRSGPLGAPPKGLGRLVLTGWLGK